MKSILAGLVGSDLPSNGVSSVTGFQHWRVDINCDYVFDHRVFNQHLTTSLNTGVHFVVPTPMLESITGIMRRSCHFERFGTLEG